MDSSNIPIDIHYNKLLGKPVVVFYERTYALGTVRTRTLHRRSDVSPRTSTYPRPPMFGCI